MMKFLRTQMKWIMAIIVVAFLLSTFLMYEGRGTRRTPGRNPDGSMTDYEVAQINGRSLMRSELEQRLRSYLSTYSTRSVTSIDMPAIYRSVLDQAILDSQLTKEVQDRGITVSDAEADMAMKNYADTYFPTREAFYQVLANSGVKVDDYKKSLARQMASERLIREAIGEVTISEDKVTEFYNTMKNILYSQPEGFFVHMADFAASADAEYFREKVASGESWDVLASGDSLASKDVINITKSPVRLPATSIKTGILSVLDSLDIGAVSPVFAVTSNDYGVAMKVSHAEAGNTPYDAVSGDIRALLTQQEERRRLTEYEDSLRKKANVVINDEELFASKTASSGDEQSGDILPLITIDETSGDEPAPVTVSEDKPAVSASVDTAPATPVETASVDAAPTTPVETASVDAAPTTPAEPASVDTAPETPAEPASVDAAPETPAVETASVDAAPTTPAEPASVDTAPETTAEPASVDAAPETPAETASVDAAPETPVETASTDAAPETPAEPASVDAAPETPVEVASVDAAPATPTETVSVDTVPATPVETASTDTTPETPAVVEAASEDVPAVTDAKIEASQDVSSDK